MKTDDIPVNEKLVHFPFIISATDSVEFVDWSRPDWHSCCSFQAPGNHPLSRDYIKAQSTPELLSVIRLDGRRLLRLFRTIELSYAESGLIAGSALEQIITDFETMVEALDAAHKMISA